MNLKKTVCLVFTLVFVLSFSVLSSASPKSSKMEQFSDLLKGSTQSVQGDNLVSTVTDPEQIKNIASKLNIATKNGKKIKKIEFCEPEKTNILETSTQQSITPQFTLYKYIKSVTDKGNGWYFPNSPFLDLQWDGPDTATISQTASVQASISSELGLSYSAISSKVGFNVTANYSVNVTSTTNVPSDSSLQVLVYILHHRVDYNVWNYNVGSADTFYGTGKAYKPNGTKFVKVWF